MKITFLGTGTPAAMPVGACPCEHCDAYRRSGRMQYRPAVLVESRQTTVLLDLGPDIRQQVITHGIRHLDAVFVTHAHRDHFGGLPEGSYAFGVLQDPLGIVDPGQFVDPTHPSTDELTEIWSHLSAKSVCLMHVSEHFTQLSLAEMAERLPGSVRVAQDGDVVDM
jgi:phosphoribosyl 1,2-cyclic phosphodiesterase